MGQQTFQKQVLSRLDRVEKTMNYLLERMEDTKLSDEEKQLLQESYVHEKEGRLISSKELKKKLGI